MHTVGIHYLFEAAGEALRVYELARSFFFDPRLDCVDRPGEIEVGIAGDILEDLTEHLPDLLSGFEEDVPHFVPIESVSLFHLGGLGDAFDPDRVFGRIVKCGCDPVEVPVAELFVSGVEGQVFYDLFEFAFGQLSGGASELVGRGHLFVVGVGEESRGPPRDVVEEYLQVIPDEAREHAVVGVVAVGIDLAHFFDLVDDRLFGSFGVVGRYPSSELFQCLV